MFKTDHGKRLSGQWYVERLFGACSPTIVANCSRNCSWLQRETNHTLTNPYHNLTLLVFESTCCLLFSLLMPPGCSKPGSASWLSVNASKNRVPVVNWDYGPGWQTVNYTASVLASQPEPLNLDTASRILKNKNQRLRLQEEQRRQQQLAKLQKNRKGTQSTKPATNISPGSSRNDVSSLSDSEDSGNMAPADSAKARSKKKTKQDNMFDDQHEENYDSDTTTVVDPPPKSRKQKGLPTQTKEQSTKGTTKKGATKANSGKTDGKNEPEEADVEEPKVRVNKAYYQRIKSGYKKYKETTVPELERDLDEWEATYNKLKEENDGEQADNAKLRQKVKDLTAALAKVKGKKGKSTKSEQASDVNEKIQAHVKDYLFRTVKFTPSEKALNSATKMCWIAIKDGLKLDQGKDKIDLAEFTRIYASEVGKAISGCRQYVQTRGQAAAKGTNLGAVFTKSGSNVLRKLSSHP